MTEYISREDALAVVCEGCNIDFYKEPCEPSDCRIRGFLRSIPAADVRPVVRGHYIGEYDGYADGNPVYDMWYCSECGCFFEDWDEKPTYNFCPNCGADMRPKPPKEE